MFFNSDGEKKDEKKEASMASMANAFCLLFFLF
jgi:hypothetical protein